MVVLFSSVVITARLEERLVVETAGGGETITTAVGGCGGGAEDATGSDTADVLVRLRAGNSSVGVGDCLRFREDDAREAVGCFLVAVVAFDDDDDDDDEEPGVFKAIIFINSQSSSLM